MGSGMTTAALPVFSRPGFTKDGESSVLGFANAPARSLRIYDWTYQYADHETWSGAPSSSLSLLLRPSKPPSPYLSLTNIASLRASLAVLSSLALRHYLSLFSRCSSSRSATCEAKRRLFRRECFRSNAETVLIAARLA